MWKQLSLALVVVVTIGLGWKYFWISFTVPLVMLINILSLFLKRGRFVCGNVCPRGAFFDTVLQFFSSRNDIPKFFQDYKFRILVLITLFGCFIYQAIRPPYTLEHFGRLFWIMCTVTTMIAILLGIFFSYRSWCAFCPVGTLLSFAGRDQYNLVIDTKRCVGCKLCEKNCPLNIKITQSHRNEKLISRDCIKCMRCADNCPKKALK